MASPPDSRRCRFWHARGVWVCIHFCTFLFLEVVAIGDGTQTQRLQRADGKCKICKSFKRDCGLWCCRSFALIWCLNADCVGTSWWAQTGRCYRSSLEPSAVTVWTAWTALTSFKACWPDAPYRASYRWDPRHK